MPNTETELTPGETPECAIEMLRYLLAEMEAGRFDNIPSQCKIANNALSTFGCTMGIQAPD